MSGNVSCSLLTSSARIALHPTVANALVSGGDDVCALAVVKRAANECGCLEENVDECYWVGERSEDRLMRGTPWEMVCRGSLPLAR